MLRTRAASVVVLLGVAAAAAYFAFFIVHVNEQAIVLEFGKPVRIINEPGLFWKIPVVQTVDYFDKRILDIDTAPQEVTASDQKRIVVDTFAPTVASGTCLNADLTDVDTYVRLFAADGITELGTDDDDGVDHCSFFDQNDSFAHLLPGTYFLSIEEYGNDAAIPSYQVRVNSL